MARGRRIVIIDNYDSFTYNLVQFLGILGAGLVVLRNDRMSAGDVGSLKPDGIVISPGPRAPRDAGVSKEVVLRYGPEVKILGVCLGHQCIGEAYGATVSRAPKVMHGKTSRVSHDGKGVFKDLPSPLETARYHSLVVEPDSLPDCLEVSASIDGIVMGLRHKEYPVEGVQFHPESFMTEHGMTLLNNFLEA